MTPGQVPVLVAVVVDDGAPAEVLVALAALTDDLVVADVSRRVSLRHSVYEEWPGASPKRLRLLKFRAIPGLHMKTGAFRDTRFPIDS